MLHAELERCSLGNRLSWCAGCATQRELAEAVRPAHCGYGLLFANGPRISLRVSRAVVMVIAADRSQAKQVVRHLGGLISSAQMLRDLMHEQRADSIELANSVTIHTFVCRESRRDPTTEHISFGPGSTILYPAKKGRSMPSAPVWKQPCPTGSCRATANGVGRRRAILPARSRSTKQSGGGKGTVVQRSLDLQAANVLRQRIRDPAGLQSWGLFRQPGIILFNSFHAGAKASSTTGIEAAPIISPMPPDRAASTVHSSAPAADGST